MMKSANTETIESLLLTRRDLSRQLRDIADPSEREPLMEEQVAIDNQLRAFPEYADADAETMFGIAYGLLAERVPPGENAEPEDEPPQPRGDAGIDQVPPEKLVELVIKSVYEGDDTRPGGTKVLGISNIQIGTPPGGWSCTAEIEDPQGRETLQVQFDGERYSDWVQGFGPEDGGREYAKEPPAEDEAEVDEEDEAEEPIAGEEQQTDAADDWRKMLVLLAAKAFYAGFDNWGVRGIRNLDVDNPKGGLSFDAVLLESEENKVYVFRVTWDGTEWVDRVLSETKADELREDAKKGGKKGRTQPKCTKGRPCGGSCVRIKTASGKDTQCRNNPEGAVKEALNKAAGVKSAADNLIAQLRARIAQIEAPKQPQPGDVLNQSLSGLKFDPKRFQYKLSPGETGSTGSLTGVVKWDANLAGVIQVWRDPGDGQTYIINGHNRATLANKLGVDSVTVRYIQANNASEARAVGALTNIAEGRGNAMDAAKFFRDTGLSRQDLMDKGIPLGEKVATDGLAISNLDDSLFRRTVDGRLTVNQASIIGSSGLDNTQQVALVKLVDARESRGKKISNDVLRELASVAKSSATQTETQTDLFGTSEVARNLAFEKAEIQSRIRSQLSREKRLFGTVANSRAAQELQRAGNQINTQESAKVSQGAAVALNVFDRFKNISGPISARINQSASAIADGAGKRTEERALYRDILKLIEDGEY